MAMDLAALKAKIAAQKAAITTTTDNTNNNQNQNEKTPENSISAPIRDTSSASSNTNLVVGAHSSTSVEPVVQASSPVTAVSIGTSLTTEIDHLEFLTKMNSLRDALLTKHPTMPVLLMQIHKQLRADPELVTTLDEEAIGTIVQGLQIQTKTALISEATKKTSSTSKAKKVALTDDMF